MHLLYCIFFKDSLIRNLFVILTVYLFIFLKDDINTIDMEEDKRDLISREISKFRDTHKVKFFSFEFCS